MYVMYNVITARKQDFDLFVVGKAASFKGINSHLVSTMFEAAAYLM
jgi:hypothetical protein